MTTTMLILSVLFTGLIAGLLYGWTVSVLPGLGHVDDATYLATMQTINRRIINPGFTAPFMITPVLLLVAAIMHYRAGETRRGWLLGAAALTYAAGVLGVTFGGNIPLNNTLDSLDLTTTPEHGDYRQHYERPWNTWHYARTAASVLAFGLALAATIAAEAD